MYIASPLLLTDVPGSRFSVTKPNTDMQNVVPCSTFQRNEFKHLGKNSQYLNKQFVQLAATNASSLNGLFLVASRHVSQYLPHMGPYFIQLALHYKIACARSLMEAISFLDTKSSISDSTVTLPLFLAQDEVITIVFRDT
jgi:hypothetical protein